MKDMAGNELAVGDIVANHSATKGYPIFQVDEVIGFSPKMVKLKSRDRAVAPWNVVKIILPPVEHKRPSLEFP